LTSQEESTSNLEAFLGRASSITLAPSEVVEPPVLDVVAVAETRSVMSSGSSVEVT
jgi:hypothetical protein